MSVDSRDMKAASTEFSKKIKEVIKKLLPDCVFEGNSIKSGDVNLTVVNIHKEGSGFAIYSNKTRGHHLTLKPIVQHRTGDDFVYIKRSSFNDEEFMKRFIEECDAAGITYVLI